MRRVKDGESIDLYATVGKAATGHTPLEEQRVGRRERELADMERV